MIALEPLISASDSEWSDKPAHPLKEHSSGCQNTGIRHVGLYASNPAASAEFYCDVLGMKIVGGSSPDHPIGATAFLSSRPDEESHEIALFNHPAVAHIAFKVSSLADGTPTVVIENGGGGFSVEWALVQPAVARQTRICTY